MKLFKGTDLTYTKEQPNKYSEYLELDLLQNEKSCRSEFKCHVSLFVGVGNIALVLFIILHRIW
jgi:hypothetical protein